MPWHGRETLGELRERAKHDERARRELAEHVEKLLAAVKDFAESMAGRH